MTQITMLSKVVDELNSRATSMRKVASDTGISYDTVLRVKNQESDPAFGLVLALHNYLFPQTYTRPDGRVVTDERKSTRRVSSV